ncbi:uncharacterized protein LOC136088660 [Hydra vulgaris]|uniref:Uncharacterized protein LOC136088660 n=1 Tax=Hydra vulgaris TaxID=6087 RepID=A0ABM4D402_HYDVU
MVVIGLADTKHVRKMPNVYKRKTTKAIGAPPDVMERTAEKVRKCSSLRSAAEQFGINKMTLSLYIRKRQANKCSCYDNASSFSDESVIEYDDISDEDIFFDEIIDGDFVIVKDVGKGREVHFFARVDIVGEGKYGGVFLQKLSGRMNTEDVRPTFTPNDYDETSFSATDIFYKLPQPRVVGGSSRCSAQMRFNCNLTK